MTMLNFQAGQRLKDVDSSNLANGYIEIQCTYPTPFTNSKLGNPKVIASFLHPSTSPDPKNCCSDLGLRDVGPTQFIQVVGLASTTKAGDVITVNWQAWQ